MAVAIKQCPGLIVLPARHGEYARVSRSVMERLHQLTPLVEQISIDEAFLDISDLPEDSFSIASLLQATIREELGLPCSLGVAANKLVAKIATDVGKTATPRDRPPNAITIVPPGEEAAFLAPLPVSALWGVGPKTAARLAEFGISTIGELAEYPPLELKRIFGKNGQELASHARGLDDRPVVTSHEIKSISQEVTFARDISDADVLFAALGDLCESCAARLQEAHLRGATIKLKIRWSDFSTHSRQMTLSQPTDQVSQIFAAASQLLKRQWKGQAVRLLGVGLANLSAIPHQFSLWNEIPEEDKTVHAES
jgi:DNA polymerase-4